MKWIKQGVLWMTAAFCITYSIDLWRGHATAFDAVAGVAWALVGVLVGLIVWAWDTWVRPVGRRVEPK
jgi:hypothetical protein